MALWNEPVAYINEFIIPKDTQRDIFNTTTDINEESIVGVFLNGIKLSTIDYKVTGKRSIQLTEPAIGYSILTIEIRNLG